VKPIQYHVHLTPDLKNFTFHGALLVDLQVKEATDTIVLHSYEIKINSASVSSLRPAEKYKAVDISYDEKEERAILKFSSTLQPGPAQLDLDFDGVLNDKMKGFYRSKYTLNGEERYMATTQFEPTGARWSFPCWDEPAVKAVFNIILTYPEHLTALSNMDPVQESTNNGLKTVKYAPTPIMSTYLVAYVIGEFDYVEGHTKDNVRVRIYTPVGKKRDRNFLARRRQYVVCFPAKIRDLKFGWGLIVCSQNFGIFRRILWYSLPFEQDGQGCHRRFRCRSYGELGSRDLP